MRKWCRSESGGSVNENCRVCSFAILPDFRPQTFSVPQDSVFIFSFSCVCCFFSPRFLRVHKVDIYLLFPIECSWQDYCRQLLQWGQMRSGDTDQDTRAQPSHNGMDDTSREVSVWWWQAGHQRKDHWGCPLQTDLNHASYMWQAEWWKLVSSAFPATTATSEESPGALINRDLQPSCTSVFPG